MADEMYARMVKREDEAIEKLRQVIDFATDDDCEYSVIPCAGFHVNSNDSQVLPTTLRSTSEMTTLFPMVYVDHAHSARQDNQSNSTQRRPPPLILIKFGQSSRHAQKEMTLVYLRGWRSESRPLVSP